MTRLSAFLDACVLVPVALTDTLLRLADAGLFRQLWSQAVLDEAVDAIQDVRPAQLTGMRRRVTVMVAHFPDALVAGWEPLVPAVHLPDPDDRHVVAAALRGRADAIATHNVRHFPADVLAPLGLMARSPDAFLLDQLDLAPTVTVDVIHAQAAATGRAGHRRLEPRDVLASLSAAGAPGFAEKVRLRLGADPPVA